MIKHKTSIPEWTIKDIEEHEVHKNMQIFLGRYASLYPNYGAQTEMGFMAQALTEQRPEAAIL